MGSEASGREGLLALQALRHVVAPLQPLLLARQRLHKRRGVGRGVHRLAGGRVRACHPSYLRRTARSSTPPPSWAARCCTPVAARRARPQRRAPPPQAAIRLRLHLHGRESVSGAGSGTHACARCCCAPAPPWNRDGHGLQLRHAQDALLDLLLQALLVLHARRGRGGGSGSSRETPPAHCASVCAGSRHSQPVSHAPSRRRAACAAADPRRVPDALRDVARLGAAHVVRLARALPVLVAVLVLEDGGGAVVAQVRRRRAPACVAVSASERGSPAARPGQRGLAAPSPSSSWSLQKASSSLSVLAASSAAAAAARGAGVGDVLVCEPQRRGPLAGRGRGHEGEQRLHEGVVARHGLQAQARGAREAGRAGSRVLCEAPAGPQLLPHADLPRRPAKGRAAHAAPAPAAAAAALAAGGRPHAQTSPRHASSSDALASSTAAAASCTLRSPARAHGSRHEAAQGSGDACVQPLLGGQGAARGPRRAAALAAAAAAAAPGGGPS